MCGFLPTRLPHGNFTRSEDLRKWQRNRFGIALVTVPLSMNIGSEVAISEKVCVSAHTRAERDCRQAIISLRRVRIHCGAFLNDVGLPSEAAIFLTAVTIREREKGSDKYETPKTLELIQSLRRCRR